MSHFKIFLGLMILGISGASAADEVAVQAKVTQAPGQPYVATFDDGREAVMKVISLDSPLFTSNVKVIDNTCTNRQGMTCIYRMGSRSFYVDMVWTKNPDPEKIGKVVQSGSVENGFSPLEAQSLVTGLTDQSGLSAGLPAHEFECTDFSWLPGSPKEAPTSLHLSRWDSEDNIANPETGVMENRTEGGAYGVDLVRLSAQKMQIQKVRALTGMVGFGASLLALGTNESLSLLNNDGDICQVGLSSNALAEAIPFFRQVDMKKVDLSMKDVPPYILNSSKVLEDSNVQSQIKYWFSGTAVYQ